MLLLSSLLASCRPLPSLLVLQDPFSAELEAARGPGRLESELRGSWRVNVQVLDPQRDPGQAAVRLVGSRKPDWVFLSPLLPLDAEALAAAFPGARFLREQDDPPKAENLHRLRFRREEAFLAAGTVVARLLPALPAPGGRTAKAGFVLAVPQRRAEQQEAAFRTGFTAQADPALLVERVIGSPADTARARQVLEQMTAEGVVVFILKAYALTGFCLEYLRAQGGYAVLEETAGRIAYPEQIILYLEEDLVGTLANLSSPAQVVEGPVRLAPGPAWQAIPEQARAALEPLE